ncbi:hypothetical protein JCM17845_22290 [Iodidimonas gelatinilytica]|uniref:Protein-export protein SecB n=2 Tax=Iodidimonas gelatinilytica TaxID=1236966 RepID=A0A5A7N3J6_9PROT|nr:protein-export chaperone SecB [Iodidimonas gelatinilytica]GER01606.1 hypothetical protein JCM17845_22290 [Iodidimonas gelatinilytica]
MTVAQSDRIYFENADQLKERQIMAENETNGGAQGAAQNQQTAQAGPAAAVLAQYVKDLSFENPNAAKVFQALSNPEGPKPAIEVNVNVGARRMGEEAYEVDLKVTATSKVGEDTAFAVELLYAGLFGARNLPENMIEPFLLVQAPHILFPFARRIVADTVRDGGFSPLMLDPIDFAALYQQQRAAAAQQQPQQSGATSLGEIDLGEPQGNA